MTGALMAVPKSVPRGPKSGNCSEQVKIALTWANGRFGKFAENRSGTVLGARKLFGTGGNSWSFVLVKLFRTGENRLEPGSRGTVSLPLPIGEGTGPSPTRERLEANPVLGHTNERQGRVSNG